MKNILVPIDGSECSFAALDKTREIAKAFDSRIVLINVIDKHSGDFRLHYYNYIPQEIEKSGEELLDCKKNVRRAGDEREIRKVVSQRILDDGKKILSDISEKVSIISRIRSASAAESIVDFAGKNDFDLVIIGSRGMTGTRSVGSVTRQVALKINTPLLIVK
ncbi:hypothetical protein SDC9_48105 [bioreactor metagenome]|uniref:UspA domain-containing protein n=1 Tax=bioreactor metagenome TaxID=1076179 RepID=A0A644WDF2_9ZZZZ